MLHLRLYIAGQTVRSVLALNNLSCLISTLPLESYSIETIDLIDDPARGSVDQIIAIPTLVRLDSTPPIKIIGDLSDIALVHRKLDLPVTEKV